MSRTRLIRPAFFKDADLFDAEQESGLPLRLAFAGLWTVADRAGRFIWKPRELKTDVLPHDPVDFAAVLEALHAYGFIRRYVVDGKHYGLILSFGEHQTFHKTEPASKLPDHDGATYLEPTISVASTADSVTDAVTGTGTGPGANYSAPLAPERDEFWEAIKVHLYAPDGIAPTDWPEERERSILRALRRVHKTGDILAAIEGVALLRDFPGKYGDPVDWLRPGDKVTLKALYQTRSGVRPMFALAIDACHRHANLSAARESSRQPSSIATLIPRSA